MSREFKTGRLEDYAALALLGGLSVGSTSLLSGNIKNKKTARLDEFTNQNNRSYRHEYGIRKPKSFVDAKSKEVAKRRAKNNNASKQRIKK